MAERRVFHVHCVIPRGKDEPRFIRFRLPAPVVDSESLTLWRHRLADSLAAAKINWRRLERVMRQQREDESTRTQDAVVEIHRQHFAERLTHNADGSEWVLTLERGEPVIDVRRVADYLVERHLKSRTDLVRIQTRKN